ncbi:GyrI-like domain-containing protein [Maribellus maritimus]|uniref:GyrI-like domain-containing protein n=1 Tax=Maribellus maritimus TaxID=2870838 RepID=UPI001EEB17A1|nr:GyrI-like domain-containing protein [Maribellus maritimus]MCG6190420.1 GyrI-like domain-containing protein [Maribellus maritimus]
MEPKIKRLEETKLVGKSVKMSFATNRTFELWRNFMPEESIIKNRISDDLYSVEIFENSLFFKKFTPEKEFQKWAAVKVSDFETVPAGMDKLIIPEGVYAVFFYKGKASKVTEKYQYIFKIWFPNSEYELDDRPHFSLMGKKYKNEDPDSEEELWFPVRKK